MYKISLVDFNGIEKIKLFNEHSGEYISIIPAYGGNINELVLEKNGNLNTIIAGDKTIETLAGKNENYYRGAKLSPFPNRINNGQFTFNGIEYLLKTNNPPHALHGLIWNQSFEIKEQFCSDTFAKLTLIKKCESLHSGYPFSYQMELEYKLEANQLTSKTKITNTSYDSIPIGDGWHPYFTAGLKINQLKLQLPPCKQMQMSNALIPNGNYENENAFSTPTILNDRILDHCFEITKETEIAETKLMDEQNNISIVVWQKVAPQGYKFIQVYTAPDRKSIAIEPMSCAPDAFNNQKGLLILSPNEFAEFSFGVRLE